MIWPFITSPHLPPQAVVFSTVVWACTRGRADRGDGRSAAGALQERASREFPFGHVGLPSGFYSLT